MKTIKTTKNVINKKQFDKILSLTDTNHAPVTCIRFSTNGLEYEKAFHLPEMENDIYNVTVKQNGDVFAVVTYFSDGTSQVVITGKTVKTKVKAPTNMNWFFSFMGSKRLKKLKTLDVSGLDVSQAKSFRSCFYCVGYSEKENPNYEGVKIFGLEEWNTSSATTMKGMFCCCNNYIKELSLDLSSFNLENVTCLNYMFEQCGANSEKIELVGMGQKEISPDIFGTGLIGMFLKFGITANFCLDLSGWKNSRHTKDNPLYVSYFAPETFLKIQKPEWLVEEIIEERKRK